MTKKGALRCIPISGTELVRTIEEGELLFFGRVTAVDLVSESHQTQAELRNERAVLAEGDELGWCGWRRRHLV